MDPRCTWCLGDELYEHYHDTEWGVPCRDGTQLFEMLNLEGAQAGLSWITILRKRERYRHVFADFDWHKIARFTEAKVEKLVLDAGIVRHRPSSCPRILSHRLRSSVSTAMRSRASVAC